MDDKALAKRIDDLEDLLLVSNESGMFFLTRKKGKDDSEVERQKAIPGQICEFIHQARVHLTAQRSIEAANEITQGELLLDQSLYSRGWWWRLVHWHQIPLFLYHLLALALLLNIGSGALDKVSTELWGVPTAVLSLGALGAILRGLYYLHRQVARRIFRATFFLSQLCAPWIGALFGLIVFLLLKIGVKLLEDGNRVNVNASFLPLAMAFLAGFSWDWVLTRMADAMGASRQQPSKPKPPDVQPGTHDPAPEKNSTVPPIAPNAGSPAPAATTPSPPPLTSTPPEPSPPSSPAPRQRSP